MTQSTTTINACSEALFLTNKNGEESTPARRLCILRTGFPVGYEASSNALGGASYLRLLICYHAHDVGFVFHQRKGEVYACKEALYL